MVDLMARQKTEVTHLRAQSISDCTNTVERAVALGSTVTAVSEICSKTFVAAFLVSVFVWTSEMRRLSEGKPTRKRRLCLKTSEAEGITSSSEEVYELML